MKTDTIFYRLFQSSPFILFELLNLEPNLYQAYQFSSVEVKQLAFRIDGVFIAERTDLPIYFIEVQFQDDSNFYGRFFTEIFLYLSKTPLSNNWRGVVLYPNRNVESTETERYSELLESERVTRIYLDELNSIPEKSIGLTTVQLITVSENKAIEQGRILINRIREQMTDDSQRQELLQLIETIIVYKLPRISRKEIEAMFSISDLKQTRVYQEALEEGREEGREEGELNAKIAAIPRLLSLELSVEQIAQALDLSIDQVRQIGRETL